MLFINTMREICKGYHKIPRTGWVSQPGGWKGSGGAS